MSLPQAGAARRSAVRGMRSATALVVWLGWALLTGAAIRTVVREGRSIPLESDWNLVPAMTGHAAAVGELLWSQSGAERQPLPRLVTLGTLGVFRDFRAATVLALLTLAALAAMLLAAVQRLRGAARLSDLLFPLLLLQPAQWARAGATDLIDVAIPLALICVVLLAVLSDPVLRTRRWAVLTGAVLLLLPLSGLAGVIIALAAAPWVGACGWRHWPPRDASVPRLRGPSLLSLVMGSVVLVGIYFSGCQPDAWNAVSPGTPPIRDAALFLSRAVGPAATARPVLALALVAGTVAATWIVLARAWTRVTDDEGYRALGVIVLMVGLGVMAVAWGTRTGASSTTGLMAVPAVLVTYIAWELYAPAMLAVGFESLLLAAALIALPANLRQDGEWRTIYRDTTSALARDISGGVPWPVLAVRYETFLERGADPRQLASRMALLGAARVGPFGRAVRPGSEATGR